MKLVPKPPNGSSSQIETLLSAGDSGFKKPVIAQPGHSD